MLRGSGWKFPPETSSPLKRMETLLAGCGGSHPKVGWFVGGVLDWSVLLVDMNGA